MTDASHHAVIERLVDTERLWASAVGNDTEPLIRAACDALVIGLDGPNLVSLAAEDFGPMTWDFPEIVRGAMAELERPFHEPGSEEARIAALGAMARRVVAEVLPPREFAAWAHRNIGHNGPAMAQALVGLGDVYDDYHGAPADDVDQEVLAQARMLADY